MSRYIGISLNDDFTELCIASEAHQYSFPTIVCKEKNSETWLVGEAAYKSTLDGSGVLVDKLLSLLRKNGTATIGKVRYDASELAKQYLRSVLTEAERLYQEEISLEVSSEESEDNSEEPEKDGLSNIQRIPDEIGEEEETSEKAHGLLEILPVSFRSEEAEKTEETENKNMIPEKAEIEIPEDEKADENLEIESNNRVIVLSVRNPEQEVIRKLEEILKEITDAEDQISVISHTESFVHYILHQDKNLYNRLVGMFELSNQCLYYYEMQVSRGSRKYVMAASEAQEEAFNLDILKTSSGSKIADRILTSLAERNLNKKSFSSVFLTGRGFANTDFAPNFMSYICKGRRGCIEAHVFAIGAMELSKLLAKGEKEEYTILCDTRVSCDVAVRVVQKEREQRLSIVHAGDTWGGRSENFEMILDRQNYVDFQLTPMVGGQRPAQLRMMLTGFPERENRCTRISMETRFLDADRLLVTVRDLGFGELFPATDSVISEEINLRSALEEA